MYKYKKERSRAHEKGKRGEMGKRSFHEKYRNAKRGNKDMDKELKNQ